MSKAHFGTPKERNTTVRRILREFRMKRALEEYEKFLSIKAYEFAWKNYAQKEDFEQEGRVAIWRAVATLEARGEKGTHQYFRTAIERAMIDYARRVHRPNHEVWVYTGPPPRVHKVRYGGKTKTKMQYFGDKLRRVDYKYAPTLNYDELFGED
jgi:DNA-directed RNA polymerase specialized sigma24 family protein